MRTRTGTLRARIAAVPEVLGIDARALAAFRMGLGALLLVDLVDRAIDLTAHYSDAGTLPLAALDILRPGFSLSLHALSGAVEWQAALFVVAGVFATALLVGYRTRLATIVSWGLLLSVHHRNPFVVNSGDSILLLLLLWGCLLPLGARWSFDARHSGSAPPSTPVFSVATAGVLLQLYAVYLLSILYKTGPMWREDFTAVYYALQLDAYATALGRMLGDAPMVVLQTATVLTLVVELGGPLLALSPIRPAATRTVAAFTLIGFHVGLVSTMTLGIFPFVCMVAWLLVLPAPFWDRVSRGAARFAESLPAAKIQSRRSAIEGRSVAEPSLLVTALACALIVVSTLIGWRALDPLGTGFALGRQAQAIDRVASVLRINERWGMFAPNPSTNDVWYEAVGVTAGGERVDVSSGRRYRPIAPEEASSRYRTERWRTLLSNYYRRDSFAPHRGHYAAFLWTDWHRRYPDIPLQSIEVAIQTEPSPAWGELATRERTVLVRYGRSAGVTVAALPADDD